MTSSPIIWGSCSGPRLGQVKQKGPVAAANEDFILDDDLTTTLCSSCGLHTQTQSKSSPVRPVFPRLAALNQPGLRWCLKVPAPGQGLECPLCRPPALGSVTCGLAETPPSRAVLRPFCVVSPSPLRLGRLLSQDQPRRGAGGQSSPPFCVLRPRVDIRPSRASHYGAPRKFRETDPESVTQNKPRGNTDSKKTPPGPGPAPSLPVLKGASHTPLCACFLNLLLLRAPRGQPG